MRYIIGCTTDPDVRAVYYYSEEHKQPIGFPIMFLRDMGMEKHAEELIELANRI